MSYTLIGGAKLREEFQGTGLSKVTWGLFERVVCRYCTACFDSKWKRTTRIMWSVLGGALVVSVILWASLSGNPPKGDWWTIPLLPLIPAIWMSYELIRLHLNRSRLLHEDCVKKVLAIPREYYWTPRNYEALIAPPRLYDFGNKPLIIASYACAVVTIFFGVVLLINSDQTPAPVIARACGIGLLVAGTLTGVGAWKVQRGQHHQAWPLMAIGGVLSLPVMIGLVPLVVAGILWKSAGSRGG